MTTARHLLVAAAMAAVVAPGSGQAQSLESLLSATTAGPDGWARTPETAVRLFDAGPTAEGDGRRMGLHFDLEPGWKIYWRNPGEAGLPPEPNWSASENVAGVDMEWPAPHRFVAFGIESIGYSDEVVFPLTMQPDDPEAPITARAAVDFLICEEICIPGSVDVATTAHPERSALMPADVELWERYAAMVPGSGQDDGLALVRAAFGPQPDASDSAAVVLEVSLRADPPLADPELLVEGPPGTFFGAPDVRTDDGGITILTSRLTHGDPGAVAGEALTLTVIDEGTPRGVEIRLRPAPLR